MPKETFFNLPEGKRKTIEDVAIEEFSEYSLDNASINRIVDKAKISKGSFYQYFEDKKDLFLYLMELMKEEKMKYISPVYLHPEKYDFFTFMREIYREGMKFALSNPKLMKIGHQFLKNRNSPAYKEALGEAVEQAHVMYEAILKMGVSKGELREDIDLDYTSHMLLSMNIAISEYWFSKIGDDYDRMLGMRDTMEETVDQFIDLIRKGLEVEK